MKKKSTKQTASTPEYDSPRETRVLLEQIDQSVRTVAEQHGGIIKRLDNIESELNSVKMAVMDNSLEIKALKEGQQALKEGQQALKEGQQEIKQKLDTTISQNEERFKRIEEKLEIT